MCNDDHAGSSAEALREKARRCRHLADGVSDSSTKEQLAVFAEELEAQAARLETNIRAIQTHTTVGRQMVAELQHTSAHAKDAARRARELRRGPKNRKPRPD